MKHAVVCLAALLLGGLCHTQSAFSQELVFPGRSEYSKATLYVQGIGRMDVRDLVIENDVLSYKLNQIPGDTLNLAELNSIKVQRGSYALPYALLGALAFGIPAYRGVEDAKDDPEIDDDVNGWPIVAAFAGTGALLGAIVGSTQPVWKTLYSGGQQHTDSKSLLYHCALARCG